MGVLPATAYHSPGFLHKKLTLAFYRQDAPPELALSLCGLRFFPAGKRRDQNDDPCFLPPLTRLLFPLFCLLSYFTTTILCISSSSPARMLMVYTPDAIRDASKGISYWLALACTGPSTSVATSRPNTSCTLMTTRGVPSDTRYGMMVM